MSRTISWGITKRGPRILLSLLTIFLLLPLGIGMVKDAQAENVSGPFKDNCPRYPVCLMNGVILKTKYGMLTAQRNMVFNRIDVNSNGSIIFDLSTWVPRAEEILLFNAAGFGNGTFTIQVLGYAMTAVSFGAAYTAQLATQLTGGLGGIVNVIVGSNMTSALQLVINYTPFGGACIPFCIGASALAGLFFWTAALLLFIAVVISAYRRRKREKPVYEMTIGQ